VSKKMLQAFNLRVSISFAPFAKQTPNPKQTTNNKQQTTNNKQQTTNNKPQTTNISASRVAKSASRATLLHLVSQKQHCLPTT
jgi:hypothetical protein